MITLPGWLVGVLGTLFVEFALLIGYGIWKGRK